MKSYISLSPIYFSSPIEVNQPFIYENIDPAGNIILKESAIKTQQSLLLLLNEFFLDVNFSRNFYVRAGKQVLKWGRGVFWNPTDFINIDERVFTDLDGQRSGTYGMKFHLPYKTLFNFYGFLDLNDTSSLETMPLSLKAEFLISGFEFSFSTRVKQGEHPWYGFDFSKGLWGWNIYAEAIYQNDFLITRVMKENNDWQVKEEEQDVFNTLIGFSKLFDRDTLSIGGEFLYNSKGYVENHFDDEDFTAVLLGENTGLNLFHSLHHSRYYLSFFINKIDFIWQGVMLTFNNAINLVDYSFLLSMIFRYNFIDEAYISIQPIIYNSLNADEKGEFTFQNKNVDILLDIAFLF